MARTWNFHRYYALHRHWARWGPPAYISAGMAIGIKPKIIEPKEPEISFEQLMAQLAPGGVG